MKHFLFISLVLFTMAGSAQSGKNTLSFRNGQKLEVSTVLAAKTSMDIMGQSMETTANSSMVQEYDVISAAANAIKLDHKINRILFQAAGGMGQNISYDSEKPEDRKGEMGKPLEPYLNRRYTMTIDAYGNVIAVSKGDTSTSAKEEGMMTMLLSQMDIAGEAPAVGQASMFKVLPDMPVAKGITWADSSSNESGSRKAFYKVSDITDTDIIVDFTENGTLQTTQQIMGFDTKINSVSTGKGKMTIDRKTGILKQKTTETDSKETIEAQGQSIPSNSKRTITMTVKNL